MVGGYRGREECCEPRGRLLGSRLEVEHECCVAGASQLGDLVPSLDVRGVNLPAGPADSNQTMHIQVGLALGSGVAVA